MKNVLITGISKGIGYALMERFLTEGYKVIGTYLNTPISYSHENLTMFKLDLLESQSIEKCVNDIAALEVKIDIVVNNAGALLDEDETRVNIEKLRETLEINLIGTIDWTERNILILSDSAHIVNISSSAGSLGGKKETEIEFANSSHFPFHYPAYKISKTALNMYTRTLAARFIHEKKDIIVSSIHPGWVKTDMGGPEADIEPSEAAEHIYRLAISRPETGQFWFEGKKYPW